MDKLVQKLALFVNSSKFLEGNSSFFKCMNRSNGSSSVQPFIPGTLWRDLCSNLVEDDKRIWMWIFIILSPFIYHLCYVLLKSGKFKDVVSFVLPIPSFLYMWSTIPEITEDMKIERRTACAYSMMSYLITLTISMRVAMDKELNFEEIFSRLLFALGVSIFCLIRGYVSGEMFIMIPSMAAYIYTVVQILFYLYFGKDTNQKGKPPEQVPPRTRRSPANRVNVDNECNIM